MLRLADQTSWPPMLVRISPTGSTAVCLLLQRPEVAFRNPSVLTRNKNEKTARGKDARTFQGQRPLGPTNSQRTSRKNWEEMGKTSQRPGRKNLALLWFCSPCQVITRRSLAPPPLRKAPLGSPAHRAVLTRMGLLLTTWTNSQRPGRQNLALPCVCRLCQVITRRSLAPPPEKTALAPCSAFLAVSAICK